MRSAEVQMHGVTAAVLTEKDEGRCELQYIQNYKGPGISLTLPVRGEAYIFDTFPAFFEGLLPEGPQLEALIRSAKIDRNDRFLQLIAVGQDMVGAVTVLESGNSVE